MYSIKETWAILALKQFFFTLMMNLEVSDKYGKLKTKIPFIVKLEIYQNDLSVARNFQRNFKLHIILVASENEEINFI